MGSGHWRTSAGTTRGLGPEHVLCRIGLTTTPTDQPLARVGRLLSRTLWSVLELHHRRRTDHDEVELTACKIGGRAEHLVAALRRDVVVIEVATAAMPGSPSP